MEEVFLLSSSSYTSACKTGNIKDVLVFPSVPYPDSRGFFKESWRKSRFIEQGLPENFFDGDLQNNVSVSSKGVVRGFHAQPWSKLMTVAHGQVDLVLLDLREGSSTYGHFMPFEGMDESFAVYVPYGVATSIYAKSDTAVLNYLVTGYYDDSIEYLTVDLKSYYNEGNGYTPSELIISEKDLVTGIPLSLYPSFEGFYGKQKE